MHSIANSLQNIEIRRMRACDCVCIAIIQDYTEEFRDITKGLKSKEALPAGSITLINQRPVGEDSHVNIFYVYSSYVEKHRF